MNSTLRRLSLVLLLVLLAGPLDAGRGQPVVEGKRLEFRLPDLDGNQIGWDDPRFRNKVLFVTAWATWCPPCISEIPTLVDLQSRLGSEGLVLVAIAFEHGDEPEERRARLRAFVGERGINYLVLDGGQPEEFALALPAVDNVHGLPVEFVIDRQGRVVNARNSRGYRKRWARKLEQELLGLLGAGSGDRGDR